MDVVIVTGSAGLIGSEAVRFFTQKDFIVAGVDNDMRKRFFGNEASTAWNLEKLKSEQANYLHREGDIRDEKSMEKIFAEFSTDIKLVIHTAAQPSHDWAAKDPILDFTINANGTLVLLEMTRRYSPDAVFIYTSTNKVYGDAPNRLPFIEHETRWEIDSDHNYHENGIDESMSIDQTLHSLYGVSKASADLLVQEYGRYFNIKTACFRGGCISGPAHSPAKLHGFLSYLVKCVITGTNYTIYGYKGKQVRDVIYSYDLVNAFWHFYLKPRVGEVYNIGGGRHSNCSVIEAIKKSEKIIEKKMSTSYADENRIGDHIWWISDISKFKSHYPDWDYKYNIDNIIEKNIEGIRVTR